MKRRHFVGVASAAALAGCGGGGHGIVASLLPGVVPSPSQPASKLTYSPAVADPIPASTLANPIVGEAARFDGAVAPGGWMLLAGQTINVADNRPLFSVIGTIGGGDGKATFKLPNSPYGFIIAVTGILPNSPAMISALKRHMTGAIQDGLGPGAQLPPQRMRAVTARDRAIADAQRLANSARYVGRASTVPVSAEMRSRMTQSVSDARQTTLDALSPSNRTRLGAAIQAAVDGRTPLYGVVNAMMPALSQAETGAILGISDSMTRGFQGAVAGHANPQLEAARFLMSVAVTPAQANTIAQRDSNL
jgi:microcystin-dependent protein